MLFLYFAIIFVSNILTALAVSKFYGPLLDLGLELQNRKNMAAFKSASHSPNAEAPHL